MARRELITGENILDTAFVMTREEGFENVTARKVAARAGCSTQPIFRVYRNMNDLWSAVYDRAAGFFQDYYSLYPRTGKAPFSNLGLAYIAFAKEEKHLFRLLFLTDTGRGKGADGPAGPLAVKGKSMYELLNGEEGNVVYEINLAVMAGCTDPEKLFSKMWIFIHGAACMSLTGDYDLTDMETRELLEEIYRAVAGVNE